MTQEVSVTPELFRTTCARFATGVAVATVTSADGTPFGLTINSFTSVSCSPPLILVCVDHRSTVLPCFRLSPYFGVNILAIDQAELSLRFSRRIPDRFEGLEWTRGLGSVPVLKGCLASFECRVTHSLDAGDHALFIGEVIHASWREGQPLLYFASGYAALQN